MFLLTCLPVKNNLGPQPPGMSFRIVEHGMEWETEPATGDWETAIASESRVACWKERKQVAEWLVNVLSEGERRSTEVQSEAREAGFTYGTLRRAASALNIHLDQKLVDGKNRWFWSLPESLRSARRAQHAQQGSVFPAVASETQIEQPLMQQAVADATCATGVRKWGAQQGASAQQGPDET